MSTHFSVWLVLLAALCAANLPFASNRVLATIPLRNGRKSKLACLLELAGLYLVVGAFALLLERHAGQIAPQGWEFYAVTVALFATLAFPGFVYRFLVRGSRHG